MFNFLMETVGVKNVFKTDRCGYSPLQIAKALFPPEKIKGLLKRVRILEFRYSKTEKTMKHSWRRMQSCSNLEVIAYMHMMCLLDQPPLVSDRTG